MTLEKIKRHVNACGILTIIGGIFTTVVLISLLTTKGVSAASFNYYVAVIAGVALIPLGIMIIKKNFKAMAISFALLALNQLYEIITSGAVNFIGIAVVAYFGWSYFEYYKISKEA